MREIAPGIWTWRAAHPEWRTGSERVPCWALVLDGGLLIVDPLLPSQAQEREAVLAALPSLAGNREVRVYVTIPYHVRDASTVARSLSATVSGHRGVQRRLDPDIEFVEAVVGTTMSPGIVPCSIGKPVRNERPCYVPQHHALIVGDVAVGMPEGARIWDELATDERRRWYRERFLPSLAPLAEYDIRNILTTHGVPVLDRVNAVDDMIASDPVSYTVETMQRAGVSGVED